MDLSDKVCNGTYSYRFAQKNFINFFAISTDSEYLIYLKELLDFRVS